MELIEKEIITKVGYDNRGLIVRVERTNEEIVRCKDCIYYDADYDWCNYWEDMGMQLTDFCSKAERKEDD